MASIDPSSNLLINAATIGSQTSLVKVSPQHTIKFCNKSTPWQQWLSLLSVFLYDLVFMLTTAISSKIFVPSVLFLRILAPYSMNKLIV